MNSNSFDSGWNGATWIAQTMRRNPEGLLLLGAGLALLMRSGAKPKTMMRAASTVASDGMAGDSAFGRAAEQGSGAIAQAAATARDGANAGVEKAKEVAGSYMDTAAGYLRSAKETTTSGSAQLKEQADRAWSQGSDLLRNQPLAIAAFGIGAGLAIAALLPSTEMEEKVVGPARDRLADTARHAGERVARAAGVAGSQFVDAIEKRGLSQSGVKDMVTEAASSFTGALADHDTHAGEGAKDSGGKQHEGDQTQGDGMQRAKLPAAS